MIPKTLPKKLFIIGGGVIGMEFASFYNAIGSDVTVLEVGADILQTEDREIVKIVRKEFEKKGIKILTAVKDVVVKNNKKSATITYNYENKIVSHECDKIISSIGVVPNVSNLGLEDLKVELEKNYIKTNEWMQTSIDSIFAIGDVTKGPWLAHKGSHEGILVADFIAKKLGKNTNPHKINYNNIPACIYSNPQISSIGMTEEQCKNANLDVKIGRFNYIGNGKALAMKDSTTLIKTIFNAKTGEILGTHMIGLDVTEMIHSFSIAKQAELVEEDIMNTIFPHPTLSEMIHESVLDAYGIAIHK
jgi:dihydrolipoamide dehydrogenase